LIASTNRRPTKDAPEVVESEASNAESKPTHTQVTLAVGAATFKNNRERM